MGEGGLSVTFETELVEDAIAEILRIRQALVHRHGQDFRALERTIETLEDGPGEVELAGMDDGRFVLRLPKLQAIIAEAKRLGV